METIYTRLANGETSEAIAEEFTNALNEAMARFEKEQAEAKAKAEAERAARLEREAKAAAKRSELKQLLNDAFAFFARHYPELGLVEGEWKEDDLNAIVDLTLALLDVEVIKTSAKSKKVDIASTKKSVTTDDIFEEFFKGLGL